MAASLLDSIFGGGGDDDDEKPLSLSLFGQRIEVPEPTELPQQQQQQSRKRRAAEEEDKPKVLKKEKPTEEENERTIFVGNLPMDINRKTLAKIFKDCGAVHSTRLRSVATYKVDVNAGRKGDKDFTKKVASNAGCIDKHAKTSMQGYVVFEEKESVARALKLNNTIVTGTRTAKNGEQVEEERHIRVDHATPTVDIARTVFVRNLPYATDEESLKDHFCNFMCLDNVNDIEGVRVVRDTETQKCRGCAYVLFQNRSLVSRALRVMNGTTYMKRPIGVAVCGNSKKINKKMQKKLEAGSSSNKKPRIALISHQIPTTNNSQFAVNALKRVLAKQAKEQKNTRKRGGTTTTTKNTTAGITKRAALESKAKKRAKQVQKRLSKGMGKSKSK